MSDDDPRDPKTPPGPDEDDLELVDLLDRLGPESAASERADLEVLGALPYALDELEAAAGVKSRLMDRVSGSGGATGRRVRRGRRGRWQLPLAAALAIALLGVAGLQFRQLEGQRRTIDDLAARLERVERKGAELAQVRRLLAEKGSHIRMMTSRGAEFCLLKPVGKLPRYPGATATMVISADRRQWFLAAEGLAPCDRGVCYRLWFITEAEPIHAASFDARGEEQRIELSGSHEGVPAGVRAITITRDAEPEREPGPPETVLLADQAMTLL